MYNFRPLQKTDQEIIRDLFHQLVSDPKKHNYFSDWEADPLIEDPNCHCVVVEHQEKVIGFGALIVFRTPVFGLKGRIEDIVIHENHRGQGLGKQLMENLISLAKEKNVAQIHLTSNPKRIAARKLYSSLGFEPYDTGVFVLDIRE